VTIEFTNATPAKSQSNLSMALLVVSCLFFFIPATLIVLGYYSSLPTGSLVSPLPKGVMSSTAPISQSEKPIIAAPEAPTLSNTAQSASNATQKSVTLQALQSEITVTDPGILEASQIYLQNREGDKSLYALKSKSIGQFILVSTSISDTDRTVDYQIVNP
jgi:hypothetical protein